MISLKGSERSGWFMNGKHIADVFGVALSSTGFFLSTSELSEWISIICTIIGIVIVIVSNLTHWIKSYKEAKKDGVITEDEKDKLINELQESLKEVKEKLDNYEKK